MKPFILELDTQKEYENIQDTLTEIYGQSTVPNVFVNNKHIGGCDKTHKCIKDGYFKEYITNIKELH